MTATRSMAEASLLATVALCAGTVWAGASKFIASGW